MTTHPEVVRALVRELQQVTPDVTVGRQPRRPLHPFFLKKGLRKDGHRPGGPRHRLQAGHGHPRDRGRLPRRRGGETAGALPRHGRGGRAGVGGQAQVPPLLKRHRPGEEPLRHGAGHDQDVLSLPLRGRPDFADFIVDVHLAAVGARGRTTSTCWTPSTSSRATGRAAAPSGGWAPWRRAATPSRWSRSSSSWPACPRDQQAPGGRRPPRGLPARHGLVRGAGGPAGFFLMRFKERSFALPAENVFGEKTLASITARWTRLFAVTPYPLPGACTRCGRCVEICPRGAISLRPARPGGAGRDDPPASTCASASAASAATSSASSRPSRCAARGWPGCGWRDPRSLKCLCERSAAISDCRVASLLATTRVNIL